MAINGEDLKAIISKFEKANEILWKGDHAKALTEFEIIAATEGLDSAFVDRVNSYINICKDKLDKDKFEPNSQEEVMLASVIALNDHETGEALELINKAVEMDPENDSVIYLQACAQLDNGDKAKAFETIKKAIELNETNKIYARNNPSFAREIKEDEAFADLLVDPSEEVDMLED